MDASWIMIAVSDYREFEKTLSSLRPASKAKQAKQVAVLFILILLRHAGGCVKCRKIRVPKGVRCENPTADNADKEDVYETKGF